MNKEDIEWINEYIRIREVAVETGCIGSSEIKICQMFTKLLNLLEQKENSLKELKEKLISYGETFDSDIHKQFQKECLEIIEG